MAGYEHMHRATAARQRALQYDETPLGRDFAVATGPLPPHQFLAVNIPPKDLAMAEPGAPDGFGGTVPERPHPQQLPESHIAAQERANEARAEEPMPRAHYDSPSPAPEKPADTILGIPLPPIDPPREGGPPAL